ncbi:MAG: PIG-L family deacetylase [Acidobacteriota bacterium]
MAIQSLGHSETASARPILRILATALVCGVLASAGALAQLPPIPQDSGITGFGLSLRELSTTGSVLCITAHPDDENNALMALLSRGQGYRVGLLTVTRGDGGQNEIGPELFEALGVLRSEELASVHRFDHVQQFFSRAYEFGYSFSVEETFQKWGREEILSDIVRVIRKFRPTVVLTLSPTGTGGGQHHQASAQLAAEAFQKAGDPTCFPEQIAEGLRPWHPLRLFQSRGPGMESGPGGDVQIDLSGFDPLLGETYAEFGAQARSQHRTQGMNVLPQPGPARASYYLASSLVDASQLRSSFFDGINVSLDTISKSDPGLESSLTLLEGYVNWATESFSRADYDSALKAVMTGLESIRKMEQATTNPESLFLLKQEERDFLEAAEKGTFIDADALVDGHSDGTVIPGGEVHARVRCYPRTHLPVQVLGVELSAPSGWVVEPTGSGEHAWEFNVKVPEDAPLSQPYWFHADPNVDRYSVQPGFTGTEPWRPPFVQARIRYRIYGVEALCTRVLRYRWFDAAYGLERRMELKVVPRFSVEISPSLAIVPVNRPAGRVFEVTVRNEGPGPASAELRLRGAAGWTVSPVVTSLEFAGKHEVQARRFTVSPPARVMAGKVLVEAVLQCEGKEYRQAIQWISYSNTQPRILLNPSSATLDSFEVRLPAGLKVGYIMGVGDDVGKATEQLGAQVTYLTREDLEFGDLSQYDVIVTGVRAYLNRDDLIANNQRLLDYVKQGGHMVVQYNKYEFLAKQFAPYPVTIHRPHDRVTVEESPVTVLVPNSPIFHFPNRIVSSDWDDWVQERGLYFLGEWDSHFTPLLELRDPWPYNNEPKQGALVVADYGKGTYIYTGLAFFRQLPAGVPGAFRLWANLLAYGSTP